MVPAIKAKFAHFGDKTRFAMPYILQLGVAAFAFLASSASVFSGLYPLGVAVATGAKDHYAIAASFGAVLGYLFTLDTLTAIQYGIAVVAALIIRPFLTAVTNRVLVMGTIPLISAASLLLMRLLLPFVSQRTGVDLLSTLAEVILILFIAFMLAISGNEVVRPQRFSQLSGEGKASLVFVFMVVAATLLGITLSGFNVGVSLVAVIACVIAFVYGERISGVFAVAALIAFSATRPELIHSAIGISVGGLFAGLFSHGEKLGIAALFFGCSVFGMVMAPDSTAAAGFIIEALVATAIFICIPKSILKVRYQADGTGPDVRSIAGYISSRLQGFSYALNEVNEIISEVFVRSNVKKVMGHNIAIDYAVENCCKSCNGYTGCWGHNTQSTTNAMQVILNAISGRGSVGPLWLGEVFKQRCFKENELCSILHKGHAIAAAERSRAMKSELMRSILCEQFCAIGDALNELSTEIYREESVDRNNTARVISLFKDLGLAPVEGTVVIEKSGKMRISVSCCRVFLDAPQLKSLNTEIGFLLGKRFFPCVVKDFESITVFQLYEVAQYTIEFAASGKAGDKSGINGDILKTFCDDFGNAHAILSDGMGKGRAAAIDASIASVLTSKLLLAGFKTQEVARLVNVALSIKANEESGATLDILSINLYTGEGILFKAGAAPTFYVSNSEIKCIDPLSLPIGIMPGVSGSKIDLKLNLFDMIIMVSDGTIGENPDWLPDLIEYVGHKNSREIAAAIIEAAKSRNSENVHDDDMSVIVLKLIPATIVHRKEEESEEELAEVV